MSAKREQERKEIFAYLGMHQPFFAHLIYQQLIFSWSEIHETAATDGRHLWFNPGFWDKLTAPQRVFVIAHEVMHCVLSHPWRRTGREMERWGIACDLLINDSLVEAKIGSMPPVGLIHESIHFRDNTAEKVYEMLPPPPPQGGQGGQGGQGQGRQGQGKLTLKSGAKPLDELIDPSSEPDADPDAMDRGWHIAAAAAKEIAKMQGKMPGNLEELVNQTLQAKINWKERLREWFQIVTAGRDKRTYMRPNRRFQGQPIIFSGWYGETVGDVVVACDTSGSVSENEWAQFKGEIQSILEEVKPKRVFFIYCDAKIQAVDEVCEGSTDYKPRFVGRGGTSFKPPFDWVEENNVSPDAFIYFTDGHGDFPEVPTYPVFWGITTTVKAPWGTTIPIVIGE